jgi:predicted DNA-binding transcriptional regulator
MARRNPTPKIKPKKKLLTNIQKDFLVSMLYAIVEKGGPVSVEEIKGYHGKSDSRVRSHLKALSRRGLMRCVGKAKVKKYVLSDEGVDSINDRICNNPTFDNLEGLCIGGKCQRVGCSSEAVDFFRDGYYCRKCIIGHDDASDLMDIRMRHEMTWCTPSMGSQLLEMVAPTFGEDLLDTEE